MKILTPPAYLLASAIVFLSLSGCALPNAPSSRGRLADVTTSLSKEELGELLQQFEDTFEATIREATERIVAVQPDRRTRRLALVWQMRLIPMARDALGQNDPVHSLLDSWALCVRQHDFFDHGDGGELFGEHQSIAREAAARSLRDVERIAALILPAETLSRTRPVIDDLARQFPLRGEFSGSTVRTAVQKPNKDSDVLASVLTTPMAPFRAFEGIDRGAAAIQGFTAVAARMTDTINDLPETVRLQIELLLMEVEDLESVQATLAGLSELSHSSARLAAVAESLPADLRKELSQATEDLEQRQASFQKTLREAQEVVTNVNQALGRVEAAAASVERTAVHTAAAGEAWTGTFHSITEMVASFRDPQGESPPSAPLESNSHRPPAEKQAVSARLTEGPSDPAPTDGEHRGFDVNDYTQAAQALDRAAVQIQELTREVRQLAGSNELVSSLGEIEARARGLVDMSNASAFSVIDHLAWRGCQLVLLLFAMLLGYAVLTRVWPSRPDRAASSPL